MIDDLLKDFKALDIRELRPDHFFKTFSQAKARDVNRVHEGSGWKEWDRCPVCGHQDMERELESNQIDIMKCRSCTHRFTKKIPVNPEEVYDSDAYNQTVQELELSQLEYRKRRFGGERASIVQGLFPDVNRRVLDVGCGWGYFLAALQDLGFECQGIELSKPVAEMARKTYGLNVVTVPVEEFRPEAKFDLVSLFGVIEHLEKPIRVIEQCRELLADSGFILIFTPNYESVAVKVQGEGANMIYPGQHLHHFTRRSIEKLAESAGMTLHAYSTKGLDIGDIYAYEKHRGNKQTASFLLANAALLQSVIDASECANHMRVILRK